MESSLHDGDSASMSSPSGSTANGPMFSEPNDLAGLDLTMFPDPDRFGPSMFGAYSQQAQISQSQLPLEHWMRDRNNEPWRPPNIAHPDPNAKDLSGMNGISIVGQHVQAFDGPYRQQYVPSECGTAQPGAVIPSDSGYGSNANKKSVTAGSVYEDTEDRSTEAGQSLAGFFTGLAFSNAESETKNGLAQEWIPADGGLTTPRPLNQSAGKVLRCNTCNKILKTNSEFK